METVAKADIFFVISSIGIVILIAVWTVAAFFVIRAVQEFRAVLRRVQNKVDTLEQELSSVRRQIVLPLLFLQKFFRGRKRQ